MIDERRNTEIANQQGVDFRCHRTEPCSADDVAVCVLRRQALKAIAAYRAITTAKETFPRWQRGEVVHLEIADFRAQQEPRARLVSDARLSTPPCTSRRKE